MHAETRLAIVLFGSFVLWFPALRSVLEGDLDAGAAGIRWGIGAAFVWLMVTALHQLIASYAMDGVDQAPRRRSDDAVSSTDRTDAPAAESPDTGIPDTGIQETGTQDVGPGAKGDALTVESDIEV